MTDTKRNSAKPNGGLWPTCERKVLLKNFLNKKVYFITLNPYKKGSRYQSYQKIGKISDWLRRHSEHHFVVREFNETKDNHYHAIVTKFDGSKMLDMNQRNDVVGGPRAIPDIPDPSDNPHAEQEFYDELEVYDVCCHFFGSIRADLVANCLTKFLFSLKEKQIKKRRYFKTKKRLKAQNTDLERVLDYMLKYSPSALYTDYIIYNKK